MGVAVAALPACSSPSGSNTATATAAERSADGRWQQPKTAWGDPDLQGMWPISHLIGTPFQRPQEYGDRRLMTEQEFQKTQERLEGRNTRYEKEIESNKMGMGHWAEATVAQRLYQFFEYACNEDNTAVRNFIVTSRYERAHAAKTTTTGKAQ